MSYFKEQRRIENQISVLNRQRQTINSITYSYIFLFSKEAHADVVPERGALRHSTCCHSVLVHGHIKVTMSLHHAACSQDGLDIKTMIREILEEDLPFETAHDERWTVPQRIIVALKEVHCTVLRLLFSKLSYYQKHNVCSNAHIPYNCWGQTLGHFQGAQKLFGISQAGKNMNTENYTSTSF